MSDYTPRVQRTRREQCITCGRWGLCGPGQPLRMVCVGGLALPAPECRTACQPRLPLRMQGRRTPAGEPARRW